MRAVLFTAMAAGLTIGASVVPAAAYDYPYCLQSRQTGTFPGDCSFQTYNQCQASASGRGATCSINPRVAFQQQRYQGRRYDRRDQGYRDQGYYERW